MPRSTQFPVIAVLLLTLTLAQTVVAEKKQRASRYALLVGVKKYGSNSGLRPLKYTETDVERLAATLISSGYKKRNVVVLTQTRGASDPRYLPTQSNIRSEMKLLLDTLAKNDTLLLAFSGHGVELNKDKKNYFCPMDARTRPPKNLISLSDLYSDLKKSPATHKLLLCDACRNDPFDEVTRAGSSVTRPRPEAPPGGIAALFACSSGQLAYEDAKLQMGVFFHAINEGLKGHADLNKDREVSLLELAAYAAKEVKEHVRSRFGARQFPEFIGKLNSFSLLNVPGSGRPTGSSFTVTKSGLKYRIIRGSTRPKPAATSQVTIHYRAWISDSDGKVGREFDSSYKRRKPLTLPLDRVIQGWQEGLQLVGEGGMIELIIPPKLGYGERGAGNVVPPNTTLRYVVELIEIAGSP